MKACQTCEREIRLELKGKLANLGVVDDDDNCCAIWYLVHILNETFK